VAGIDTASVNPWNQRARYFKARDPRRGFSGPFKFLTNVQARRAEGGSPDG
jgi:hypothetical protein